MSETTERPSLRISDEDNAAMRGLHQAVSSGGFAGLVTASRKLREAPTGLVAALYRRALAQAEYQAFALKAIVADPLVLERYRAVAAQVLGQRLGAGEWTRLGGLLASDDPWCRFFAIRAVASGPTPPTEIVEKLETLMSDDHRLEDVFAVVPLCDEAAMTRHGLALPPGPAVQGFTARRRTQLSSRDPALRFAAIRILSQLGDFEGVRALKEWVASGDDEPRGEGRALLDELRRRASNRP